MSYTIAIGELIVLKVSMEFTIHRMELPDAPEFPGDAMTGKSNMRHPSYGGWYEFLHAVGLPQSFYVQPHPGWRTITQDDLIRIRIVLQKWKASNPKAVPGFDSYSLDPMLARLIWLEFWTARALSECTNPGVENY